MKSGQSIIKKVKGDEVKNRKMVKKGNKKEKRKENKLRTKTKV